MQDNNVQEIKLSELNAQQLDSLAVTLAIQIAQAELNKANLVNTLAVVQAHLAERKAQAAQQTEIRLPKLNPIKTPTPTNETYSLQNSLGNDQANQTHSPNLL